jgi:transcriptional regulator with XRE-family HTH domain
MEKTVEQIIAENLISLRKSKNLKQSDLSEAVGYSDKTISRWENGTSTPDIATLINLAKFYEVSVEDLISEDAIERRLEQTNKVKKEELVNLISLAGLGILTIWMIAVLIYLGTIMFRTIYYWQIFVLAIPASCIIVYRYTRKNYSVKWLNFLMLSLTVCGSVTFLYLSFIDYNFWQLFMLVVPLEGICAISAFFPTRIKRKRQRRARNTK